jgi:Anti-sigma-K factor rskA
VREPPELRDLVGDDLTPEELERLRRIDTLLRRVPPPPAEIPQSLTQTVAQLPLRAPSAFTRRRAGLALALAATVAALAFGVGRWTAGHEFDTRLSVTMEPSEHAPAATALIRIGERDDASGNWPLELDVSGLPSLPPGGYYVLWLAKDGEYAATCGTFAVGEGETEVHMTVSYRLSDYDAWVITAHSLDEEEPPWLLRARIAA